MSLRKQHNIKKEKKANDDFLSRRDVLLMKENIKNSFIDELSEKFNLVKVDPVYIGVNEFLPKTKRSINFDNALNNTIYSFNLNMDFACLRYFKELKIEIDSGIICYYSKFYRDFKNSNFNSPFDYNILIQCKIKMEDLNEECMLEIIKEIFKLWNKIIIQTYANNKFIKPLPRNISSTNIDKILKTYPLLQLSNAINQEIYKEIFLILFGINGRNKKAINLLTYDREFYTNIIYADIYLYSEKMQEIIDIGSIYQTPTIKHIQESIELNNLNKNTFADIKHNFPTENNQITINLNISKMLMYSFGLKSINDLL